MTGERSERSEQPALYGIQMLRAVAAVAVTVHHTLEQSNGTLGQFSPDWLTTSGASGVDIFFVVSGFIMLHVSFGTTRPPPGAGSFLFRRATRIYPFYWLCCLGVLAISAMGFLAAHPYPAPTIIGALLLLPGKAILGVSWTLVFEVYFYLIFAATLWMRTAIASVVATTAAILLMQGVATLLPAGATATFLQSPLPLEFCFGLWLAYGYSRWPRGGRRWPVPPVIGVIAVGLMAIAPLFVAHADTGALPALPRVAVWGLPALMIVASALTIGPPRTMLARAWVVLGNASYALYLTHVFVMMGYGRLLKIEAFARLPQQGLAVLIVLLCLVVGVAAHLFLEQPLLVLVRRLTHRRSAQTVPIDQPA